MTDASFKSFADFYPYYLNEHSLPITRRLHFIGSSLALVCILFLLLKGFLWYYLVGALLFGYGFAWIAHFRFEKNRPATFRNPLYSLMGDWKMWWEMLTGKIEF